MNCIQVDYVLSELASDTVSSVSYVQGVRINRGTHLVGIDVTGRTTVWVAHGVWKRRGVDRRRTSERFYNAVQRKGRCGKPLSIFEIEGPW